MAGSSFGTIFRITTWGESHGPSIGVVVDGCPAGLFLSEEDIQMQLNRRRPGQSRYSTPRNEADRVHILSGIFEGRTTGTPIAMEVINETHRSKDYSEIANSYRPGHADYTFDQKYGFRDYRGGGHFSGRLTACLVFAGAVCRQILERRGITIGAHAYAVGSAKDTPFDPVNVSKDDLNALNTRFFAVNSPKAEEKMRAEIEAARLDADSIGGIIECAAVGVPAGIGSPMFGGIENVFASILYGIPAVKGVEFGAGFDVACMRGSENNDAFYYDENGLVRTKTNNAGGILGGITTGMPILFRIAVKPTPSIGREQHTVDLTTKTNADLTIHGRHDPCIVPRAIPVAEAAAALALMDLLR